MTRKRLASSWSVAVATRVPLLRDRVGNDDERADYPGANPDESALVSWVWLMMPPTNALSAQLELVAVMPEGSRAADHASQ